MGDKKVFIGIIVIAVVLIGVLLVSFQPVNDNNETIRIGWISALTGPVAQYGAYEAGMIAVEEINANGGINGKQIVLIAEDGQCKPKTAVDAMNKLVFADQVKYVLGGHCAPESMSIAPIAEDNKVLLLASITTNPYFKDMGDYVFRTSPVSVIQSEYMADLSFNELGHKKMAVIYAVTDYAGPIAEKMRDEFIRLGGEVTVFAEFQQGETDFRSILTKVGATNPDAILVSAQTPVSAFNLVKQIKEFGINAQIFGNDVVLNSAGFAENPSLQEDIIGASPHFDKTNEKTVSFVAKYKEKYGTGLPYGVWTAESYDGVHILAKAIEECGEDVEEVKKCLYATDNYLGASGLITIDEFGDGIRKYSLVIVKDGELVPYE